ncbi:hypothetical protein ACLB2K_063498 [Fragaria x ananassa]
MAYSKTILLVVFAVLLITAEVSAHRDLSETTAATTDRDTTEERGEAREEYFRMKMEEGDITREMEETEEAREETEEAREETKEAREEMEEAREETKEAREEMEEAREETEEREETEGEGMDPKPRTR